MYMYIKTLATNIIWQLLTFYYLYLLLLIKKFLKFTHYFVMNLSSVTIAPSDLKKQLSGYKVPGKDPAHWKQLHVEGKIPIKSPDTAIKKIFLAILQFEAHIIPPPPFPKGGDHGYIWLDLNINTLTGTVLANMLESLSIFIFLIFIETISAFATTRTSDWMGTCNICTQSSAASHFSFLTDTILAAFQNTRKYFPISVMFT
jgi:hypothetical protein